MYTSTLLEFVIHLYNYVLATVWPNSFFYKCASVLRRYVQCMVQRSLLKCPWCVGVLPVNSLTKYHPFKTYNSTLCQAMLLFGSIITRSLIMSEKYKMRLCLDRVEMFLVSVCTSCRYIYMYVVYLFKGCDYH